MLLRVVYQCIVVRVHRCSFVFIWYTLVRVLVQAVIFFVIQSDNRICISLEDAGQDGHWVYCLLTLDRRNGLVWKHQQKSTVSSALVHMYIPGTLAFDSPPYIDFFAIIFVFSFISLAIDVVLVSLRRMTNQDGHWVCCSCRVERTVKTTTTTEGARY